MVKLSCWKSPGPFSQRKPSAEEYVWLGFTLWYNRCLTMRWLGLVLMVIDKLATKMRITQIYSLKTLPQPTV